MLWREPPTRFATSEICQPSCTTASTAWYRCSMTDSSTSTGHLLLDKAGQEHGGCQGSAGATVKDQPEQVSRISRNRVKDQVTPLRKASPEARHTPVDPRGFEPLTYWLPANRSTN